MLNFTNMLTVNTAFNISCFLKVCEKEVELLEGAKKLNMQISKAFL